MDNGERRRIFANNEAAITAIACDSWEKQENKWRNRGQDKDDVVQSSLCCALELLSRGTPFYDERLQMLVRAHLNTQLAIPVNEYTVGNFEKICNRRRR